MQVQATRSSFKHIAGALLAMMLSACASTDHWPQSGPDSPSLPQRVLLEDVPFYPQERFQCGPASLAMTLNSQGLTTNPDVLRELVYIPGREGTLQVELIAAGRAHNFLVYQLDGTLDSLLKELAAGNPVLVMQNLRFGWWPQWHFAVAVGFDSEERTLILNTDTRKHYEAPIRAFINTWGRADNWAVVMLPPDQVPATAEPLKFLDAGYDLESTGQTLAAMTAYQTAEQQWPNQPAAVFGQGNLAYDMGNRKQAVRHFSRMVTRFPDIAEGWNNLGHTLGELGCRQQATEAQLCASRLAPLRFSAPAEVEPPDEIAPEYCSIPACPQTSITDQ
ncbi:PA2778 family cysteine peptidase [Marinobacter sp. F4216]|uniref:PA2778 family cysteine peptidase n=1 Tax=Marinobacter sp. F4216 TaxID=2874281 RepID=UPI001CBAE56E|nr:PA2778 family cysteine peptidase [Marinobacter sp. F4216]